jgi:DNA-binding LacI/PurR family transcriptional regulator
MPETLKTPSRPTISDVARRAGVSTATVSRVINRAAPVAEETAQRVWAAVDALGYTPSAPARMLASDRTGTIGLVIPEISGDFFAPMLRGIENGVRDLGYDLLIYANPNPEAHRGAKFPYPLGEHNTDGMMVFTDSLEEEEITRLHRIGFPLVLLHRMPPPGLDIPSVGFSNKFGARLLIDHLIEVHGYRRIGFLAGPPNNEDSHWREMGYREALEAHGLEFDPAWVRAGGFDDEVAQATMVDWLRDGLDIQAVFSGDDESALGVMVALREAGLRIPEDLAVVGFDDIPLSRHLTPPLTTVRAPIEAAGVVAARQLANLIHGEIADSLTLLPTELMIRRSCGCHIYK